MRIDITCIMCPLGCNMKVQVEGKKVIDVQGNKCKKGITHAEHELFSPLRILTTTVRTDNAGTRLLPVRSNRGIPKESLMECMRLLSEHAVSGPVRLGQTVVENILGLGTDIVACRSLPLDISNQGPGR
jgi:CxxC motif-containing protein